MKASEWAKQGWTVGQYTPSENFKQIANHSCVCRKDDMGLIAITGPAEDLESQKMADLFAAAPEMLEALKELEKYYTLLGTTGAFYERVVALIAKAEGKNESKVSEMRVSTAQRKAEEVG